MRREKIATTTSLSWSGLSLRERKKKKKPTLSPQFLNYISVRAEISIKASARYYKVNFLTFKHAWGCYQLRSTSSGCFFNANVICDIELTAGMEDYQRFKNWFESIWSGSFSPGTWSKQSPRWCLNNFPSVSHPYLLGLSIDIKDSLHFKGSVLCATY